jgi:restriction system protein
LAEITHKRKGEIVRKVFEILSSSDNGIKAGELMKMLRDQLQLTDYEKGFYPSSPTYPRIDKITRFSTIPAVKAGWLIKSKGIWSITEDGKEAYNEFQDPVEFSKQMSLCYKSWSEENGDEDPSEADENLVERQSILEEAQESAWANISDYLSKLNPYDFQKLVAELLTGMEYHVHWISPPGKDGGLDILAYSDPLGTSGPRIKVQVKRRQDKINVEGVRSFISLLGDSDVGIFVSAGGFTSDAEQEVRAHTRRIMLLDMQKLFDLWIEYYDSISEEGRKILPLTPVYFLSVTD